jgi:hypothetical protein
VYLKWFFKVEFRLLCVDFIALQVLNIKCEAKSQVTDRILTDGLRQLSLERFELNGHAFSVSL